MDDFAEGLLARNLSTEEKLLNALRMHIGDDDDIEGYEFTDNELYLFLRDGNRVVNSLGETTNLTFASDKISIAGTITDKIALIIIFAADYILWRRLEREGTRGAISIREMDTSIDTREIARSASAALKERWKQLREVIKELQRGDLTPWRINSYVQRAFPAPSQDYVDETRSDSVRRI